MIEDFRKELRKLRVDHDDTLKSMASKLGISSSQASNIELGRRKVPEDYISKISDVYNLSDEACLKLIHSLLYEDGDPTK